METKDLFAKKIYELRAIAKRLLGLSTTSEIKKWILANLEPEEKARFSHLNKDGSPNFRYKSAWIVLCCCLLKLTIVTLKKQGNNNEKMFASQVRSLSWFLNPGILSRPILGDISA
jgi:hypothetical protein